MADIVMFPQDDRDLMSDGSETGTDTFLLEEGLDMLAAYRAIRNPSVRASLRQLAKTLGATSGAAPRP